MQIRITQSRLSGSIGTSTLNLIDDKGRARIETIGVINHMTQWAPAGDLDAAVLRDWLEAHYDIERDSTTESQKKPITYSEFQSLRRMVELARLYLKMTREIDKPGERDDVNQAIRALQKLQAAE